MKADTMFWLLVICAFAFADEERTTPENLYDGEFEHQVMFSVPEDNRTDNELTLLELLDREICTILMDPYGISGRVVSDKDGDNLINNISLFEKYVIKARKMWTDKKVKQDKALLKSVKVLFDKGWPDFMILPVEDDGQHLMKNFNWNVSEMYDFYEYRNQANAEWDDLRSIIECE